MELKNGTSFNLASFIGAAGSGGRQFIVLDYWWYLDGNPARVAGGTSCGVGLSLPGKTCFDHDSDWEGITVVLEGSAADAVPVAIQSTEAVTPRSGTLTTACGASGTAYCAAHTAVPRSRPPRQRRRIATSTHCGSRDTVTPS
jgi:hypothetical protein